MVVGRCAFSLSPPLPIIWLLVVCLLHRAGEGGPPSLLTEPNSCTPWGGMGPADGGNHGWRAPASCSGPWHGIPDPGRVSSCEHKMELLLRGQSSGKAQLRRVQRNHSGSASTSGPSLYIHEERLRIMRRCSGMEGEGCRRLSSRVEGLGKEFIPEAVCVVIVTTTTTTKKKIS